MPVWWRRKDNFKTMMVVKAGKNMIVAGWWRREDNKVGAVWEERKSDDRNCACNDREEKTA